MYLIENAQFIRVTLFFIKINNIINQYDNTKTRQIIKMQRTLIKNKLDIFLKIFYYLPAP